MGIISEIFKSRREKKAQQEQQRFDEMNETERSSYLRDIVKMPEQKIKEEIEKKPYILPYIFGDLNTKNLNDLVDIATKNNVSIYSLVDKNENISNATIINIAVENQPELVLELDDMENLQDLISSEALITAFTKNPEVLFSNCKALKTRITLKGDKKGDKDVVRVSTLRAQLQRALNLYFRPEAYRGNKLDDFAKGIADRIQTDSFLKIVESNKMLIRSTTAANETLKRNPEKGRVIPAKALKNWNNRTLYVIPNEARKKLKIKGEQLYYTKHYNYVLGLMKNSSLMSFSKEELTRFAKRCVSVCPDVFFALDKIKAFEGVSDELTIQITAYETFKKYGDKILQERVLDCVNPEQQKKLLAKVKANETRKANKNSSKSKAKKEVEKTL